MGRGMGAAVRGGGCVQSGGGGKSTSSDKGYKSGGRVGYKDGGEVHARSGTQGLAKRGYKQGGLTAQENGIGRVKKAIGGMMGPPGAPAGGMPQITPQMVQAAQQAQGGGGGPGMMPPPAAGAPMMPPPQMKKGGVVKKAMGGVIGNSMGTPGAGGAAMGALQNQGAIVGAKKRKKLTKLGGMKAPSQPMASPAGGAFPGGPGNALPRPGS